jgi:excisionase family DNA binding protein
MPSPRTAQSTPYPPDLMGRVEAARLAGIHPAQLYRAIRAGRIRHWRVFGRLKVSRAEVLASVEPGTVPLTPEAEARARAVETMRTLEGAGVMG